MMNFVKNLPKFELTQIYINYIIYERVMEELQKISSKQKLANINPRISINKNNIHISVPTKYISLNQQHDTTRSSDLCQSSTPKLPNQLKYLQTSQQNKSPKPSKQRYSITKRQLSQKLQQLTIKKVKNQDDNIEQIIKIILDNNLFSQFNHDIKIIKIIAEHIQIIFYQYQQIIFYHLAVNHFIHKIMVGQVGVKNYGNKNFAGESKREIGTDNLQSTVLKEKGEYLENVSDFKSLRQSQATSLTQTYIIRIHHEIYDKIMKIYIKNRSITRIMSNSQLFYNCSYKQIERLIQKTKNLMLIKNMILFYQNQNICLQENRKMYFIIEGDFIISKKINQKQKIICTINDGNIVGDQAIFCNQCKNKRQYNAIVKSLTASVLQIQYKVYCDWLKLNGTSIQKNIQSKALAEWRLIHYNTINGTSEDQKKLPLSRKTVMCSLGQQKKQRLRQIVCMTGNIQKKVQSLQAIKKKRLDFNVTEIQVNFQHPLFRAGDLPGLGGFLKRFIAEEKRMVQFKDKMKKLSKISPINIR